MTYSVGDYEVAMVLAVDSAWTAQVTFALHGVTTAANIATDVANAMTASHGPLQMMPPGVLLSEVIASDLTGGNPPIQTPLSNAGGASSQHVPPQVALVWRLGTGVGGRSNRGRMFWPGVSKDYLTSDVSHWSATGTSPHLDLIASDWLTFWTGTTTSGGKQAVNSRKLKSLRQITSIDARTGYLGTQRRRSEQMER